MAAANPHCLPPPSRGGEAGEKVRLCRAWNHTLARQAWHLGSNDALLRGVFVGQTRSEAERAHAAWSDARRRDGHPALLLVSVPRLDAAAVRRQIGRLPPAALAELCGSDDGGEVGAYSVSWRQWVAGLGAGHRWDGWRECHDDFVAHLEVIALTMFAP
jgi:hypothetical protein